MRPSTSSPERKRRRETDALRDDPFHKGASPALTPDESPVPIKDIGTYLGARGPPSFDGEALIRMKTVKQLCGLGASTIYRLAKTGQFPRPLRPFGLGQGKISCWRYTEVARWIQDRIDGKPL
jgi:predicted DNA-binding transcriptional regulator AlpA